MPREQLPIHFLSEPESNYYPAPTTDFAPALTPDFSSAPTAPLQYVNLPDSKKILP